jgi:hypothetical protein
MQRSWVGVELRRQHGRGLHSVAKQVGQAQPRSHRNRFSYSVPKNKPSQGEGGR